MNPKDIESGSARNSETFEKLLLPIPKTRKGTKAKPSVPHKDKKKEEKGKHKSE